MTGDAVIFIPGIKGTKLVDTNHPTWDTIWSGVQTNFETLEDLEITGIYKGQYFEENPASIIQPGEIETLAYGEFLHDLKTDKPIYIFNYDWRLSARQNGTRLATFMDYLIDKSKAKGRHARARRRKPETPIKCFDFITHSLGNFVLRNYLFHHGFNKVNKIVFTVPPFQGSIDIVSAALIGEGVFPNVKAKIRKLIRTFPGALELLPNYAGASRFDARGAHSFFTFGHWQSNVINGRDAISEKMKQALRLAKRVSQQELCDLSTLSAAQRQRILILVRDGYDTWQSVRVLKKGPDRCRNFVDFDSSLRSTDGDGRVPHVSSCCYCDSIQTLLLKDSFWYREHSHGFVLKDERVQKLVNRFLFSKRFKASIPGGSIQRVRRLLPKTDSGTGLPYWQAQ